MTNKQALVVIDVQEALVEGAYRKEQLLENLAELLTFARSENIPVIYVQHNHSTYPALMSGADGWKIHASIAPQPEDTVIQKEASDAFYDTNLEHLARQLDVDELIVTGMQTEYCVDATCRSALSRGLNVLLVSDCHTTGDSKLKAQEIIDHHNAVLVNLAHPTKTVRALTCNEVITCFKR